jgi:hypothetical protein
MSRMWAEKNGHPDELTPDQIATCIAILRPALLATARQQRSERRRGSAA